MSIQFRARIKSAADYTNHFSDMGVCCHSNGNQVEDSYINCINAGGYFQYVQVLQGETPGDVVCPDISDTGCCCACEYVDDYDAYLESIEGGNGENNYTEYMGGLKDVSRCECNRIGGVWDINSCETYKVWQDVFNLCTNGAYGYGSPRPVEDDRRFPEGCCVNYTDDTHECLHVCSSGECSDLQDAAWPDCCPDVADEDLCDDCPHCCASHYPTVACGEDPTISDPQDWIVCGDERGKAYSSGGNAFNDDEHTNVLVVPKYINEDEEERYRNTISGYESRKGVSSVCITTEDRVDYGCRIKTKNLCSGIWMGLNDAGFPFKCNDTEVGIIRDFLKNGTLSKEVTDGWKFGEYHIAGHYAGIFNYGGEDASNTSIEGFGNPKTGPCQPYKIESNSKDIKEFKSFAKSQYAVLISPHDFDRKRSKRLHSKNQFLKNQSKSKFDSVRNMVTPLDLFNTVNSYTFNGVGGWKIPSYHLLAFIANQIQNPKFIENTKNNKAYEWEPMNGSYWSSSLWGDTTKQSMAYVQDFDRNFVSLCPVTYNNHKARFVQVIKIN